MAKKTISQFETRSILESLVNIFYKPVMTENDFSFIRNSLDSVILRIQQTENQQLGVSFSFKGHRSATRFFNTEPERKAFKQALMICPSCDSCISLK